MMALIVGWIMIILGLLMVILGVLVWLGVVTVPKREEEVSWWDLLKELLKKAPWVVVVGLLLIWVGLKLVGVDVGL